MQIGLQKNVACLVMLSKSTIHMTDKSVFTRLHDICCAFPFPDVNQSGEIDKKDFELAIEVSVQSKQQ